MFVSSTGVCKRASLFISCMYVHVMASVFYVTVSESDGVWVRNRVCVVDCVCVRVRVCVHHCVRVSWWCMST